MIETIVLDTGVLGLATHPRGSTVATRCNAWVRARLAARCRIVIPEIADYELRRELLRANKARSVRKLDELESVTDYVPISTAAMRLAAHLWADARTSGRPTATNAALDGDVILAAQALSLDAPAGTLAVATTNVDHLARFVPARLWEEI